jgi:hypothetical protein
VLTGRAGGLWWWSKTINDTLMETPTLVPAEAFNLARYEQVIERGLNTFVEVGESLSAIRDGRLYRETHTTFEAYCRDRWGFTDRRARQLMEAAGIGTMVPEITTERQARELAKVEPAKRQEVVERAQEATGGKITAAAIREARQEAQDVAVDVIPPAPPKFDRERFSQAMMHADNACACIDKIPPGDPQLRAALAKVKQHIEARIKKEQQ